MTTTMVEVVGLASELGIDSQLHLKNNTNALLDSLCTALRLLAASRHERDELRRRVNITGSDVSTRGITLAKRYAWLASKASPRRNLPTMGMTSWEVGGHIVCATFDDDKDDAVSEYNTARLINNYAGDFGLTKWGILEAMASQAVPTSKLEPPEPVAQGMP